MPRFTQTYTTGPPNALDRIAYRRRYEDLPFGLTHVRLLTVIVLLFPVSWRWLNRAYASFGGYFWLPCKRCGREYGGHEMGRTIWDQHWHAEGGESPAPGVEITWKARTGTNVCRYCSHEIQNMMEADRG